MPTDPFVAPDLDDRPRQQQNLPPGLGYPPARSWRADRPGDLGSKRTSAAQPGGTLRGRPGPNVGYGYTLAERAKDRFRLAAHEDLHDAVSVVAEIGMKRAAAFGRAPVIGDVELAMALLGYDDNVDDAVRRVAGPRRPRRRARLQRAPRDRRLGARCLAGEVHSATKSPTGAVAVS